MKTETKLSAAETKYVAAKIAPVEITAANQGRWTTPGVCVPKIGSVIEVQTAQTRVRSMEEAREWGATHVYDPTTGKRSEVAQPEPVKPGTRVEVGAGGLGEVVRATPATSRREAGFDVRELNTGRGDYGGQVSGYTTWYPANQIRRADEAAWRFDPVRNRFYRAA